MLSVICQFFTLFIKAISKVSEDVQKAIRSPPNNVGYQILLEAIWDEFLQIF